MSHNNENTLMIILVSCVATIGGFLFGFDSGVINGTVDGLQSAFNSDNAGTGFNVSSMLLGCAVGAFSAGRLADRFGRRPLLITAAIFFIISAWGSGISTSSMEFVVYRILGGLAVGAASVMAPAYISEIAPARFRGTLSSVQQVAIIFGLFSAFVSNYFLADFAGASTAEFWMGYQAWRWMFWIELIPATLFLVALMFIPESPRYLVMSKNTEKAKRVLNALYGDAQGQTKLQEIEASRETQASKPKLTDLIDKVSGKIRPIMWVGIGLAVFQQLVGINVVFYYGAVLWQAAGFSESDALMINVISGAVSIAAVFVTMFLIDKVGRKPFLLIGSVGMTFALGTMVYIFANSGLDANGNLSLGDQGVVALVAANAYVFFFNLSWGPVMWVMLGEMFPNQIRGSGLAVAGFAQWGANFIVTFTFPVFLASIGLAGAYSIYALGALISIVFVYKLVQETRGKELEEMQG
ncbi:sugar porter family MFS transporter [Paraglaciecola chathamensis]|uniref:Sugar porter family MFS transporter n=1 Tax=Paraglaciecola chathamensis TaxID=368405 RepID=A0ABS0WFL3_9ALTE|nr:sugar porter family MFS transporter [Paraglaciecola chathamensis]MBJ2137248.1 sugar porter family MFS transporter [Paraglaciecola chathamensis]MDO6839075.1 sugar porter family MFS transporter [Paraglaciecola chathamensis]